MAGALVSPKGITKNQRAKTCLSYRSSFARFLLRYAPGSSPTVDPTSRSMKRSVKQVRNQSGYLFLMVRLPG